MAKLYFKVGSDVDRVIQLRQEISKLKQELMSMDVNKAPAAAKALQTQIGAATQEFTKLTTEAAKAGAVMESDFKTKIYQSSQSVNDLTQKITNQKVVIKDVEADVRRLSDAYRSVRNNPLQSSNALGELNAARKALQEEKSVLFGLQTEQSNARLSVKKLRDEYTLYKDETKSVVDANGGMSVSFKKVLASIGGVYAVKELLGQITSVTGMFQKYESVLTNALNGDSALAKRYMSDIATFAAETNFQLDDLTDNFIKLVNRGVTPTIDTFGKLGDFANVTAKPMGQLNEAILDINNPERWKEFGVQVSTEGKKVSLTFRGMKIEAERSVESVMKAIEQFASMDGVAGTTKSIAGTIEGQMSNFQDTVTTALNEIGQHNKEFIAGSIEAASVVVQNYETIGKATMVLVATYGTYRTALILNTVLEQGFNKAIWAKITATKAATIAQSTYNKVVMMNPYVAVGSAVLALGISMYALADHTTSAEKAQQRFNETSSNQKKQLDDLKNGVDGIISVIKSETSTQYDKIKSYKELQKLMPAVFSNMDIETLKLMDILSLNKQIAEEVNRRERVGAKTNAVLRQNELNSVNARLDKAVKEQGESPSAQKAAIIQRLQEEKAVAEESVKIANKAVEDIVKIQNEANKPKSEKSKIQNKEYWEDQKKSAEKALVDIDSKQKKLLDSGKFDGIDAKVVQNYKNQSKMLKEAQEELKVYDMSGKNNKEESASEKLRKQNAKFEELTAKQSSDRIRAEKDLQVLVDQARIDAMEEGSDKSIAQMRLNHQKEIEELKRMREDYLQKKIDAEKMRFDSNPGNKGKSFDASGISLDANESKMFSDMMSHKVNKQGNDLSAYYKELLSKYKGYTEQRLSAQEKYQKERELLSKSGASSETLAEHDYQRDEALKAIDSEFAMREESFKSWADGITNLSLSKLQEMLVQAEQELQRSEFLNPKDTGLASQRAKVTSLKNTISEKSEKAKTSPDKRSNKEWQELYKTLSKVERQFDDIGDTVGGTAGEIISAAGGISTATLQMVDGIVTLANGSSQAMAGTAQAASASIQAVEKASVILAIIGAALQIATKIADMFAADYSDYNEAKKNYENYVKVLDIVIEKQKELIATLTGKEAVKASKDALELIEKQAQAARNLGKERLNAGASAGSSSIGVRIKKNMSNEGWNEVQSAIGINAYNKIKEGRMEGLFNLSVEQLKKLQMEAPEFWAKLDGDVSNYLEQIIACNEKTEEMKDILNESLTNTSFDSVRDGFLDALSDMNTSAADFADDFSSYMQKAILNTMMAKTYEKRLNDWYESFANSNKDGEIDKIDYDKLQKDWESIVSDALVDRDKLKELFGWTSDGSSQESTKGGFQAMSQDTGDELNGRFTALQISNEEIKNQGILQAQSLEILSVKTDAILFVSTETRDIADETRTILANSYIELVQISENTGESAKALKIIQSDIAEVKRNTGRI